MASPVNTSDPNNVQGGEVGDAVLSMDSLKSATIGNAKALFGILFIQYCSYAFFYIMDHILNIYPEHFTELKYQKEQDEKNQKKPPNKKRGQDENQEDDSEEEPEGQQQQQKSRGGGTQQQQQQQQRGTRQGQQDQNPRAQKYQQNVQIEKIDEDEDDSEEEVAAPQGRGQQRRNFEGGEDSIQYEGGQGRRQGQNKQKQMKQEIEMQRQMEMQRQQQMQQQQRGRGQQQDDSDDDDDDDDDEDEQQQSPQQQQRGQQQNPKAGQRQQQQKGQNKGAAGAKGGDDAPKKPGVGDKISNMVKEKAKLEEMTAEEMDQYEKWEKGRLQSISNQIVEYFPQIMIWHTLIVSICAIRSPVDFAVSCTLFSMLMRIVMVFGYYCNKKMVYIAASGLEIFCNFCLFFIAMSYNQYD